MQVKPTSNTITHTNLEAKYRLLTYQESLSRRPEFNRPRNKIYLRSSFEINLDRWEMGGRSQSIHLSIRNPKYMHKLELNVLECLARNGKEHPLKILRTVRF